MLANLSSTQLNEWAALYKIEAEDAELERLRAEAAAKVQR